VTLAATPRPAWRSGGQQLFRQGGASPAPVWLLVLAVLAGTGISLARQPGAGALDTVWAEDGTIFLTDAWQPGFWDELWSPYAGYLHVAPRALAELAALFPASWAAAVLATEAAALTAGMAVVVFVVSAAHLPGTVQRVVASAPVVLLHLGQGDLLNAIANLHWPALYVTFWLLVTTPATRWGTGLSAGFVAVTAASDILVMAYLPLAALRALTGRGAARWLPTGALLVGLATQLLVRLVTDASRGLDPELNPVRLAGAVVARLVPLAVLGERFTGDPRAEADFLVAAAAAWLVALVVLVASVRTAARRDLLFPLVAAAHALVLYLLPSMLAGVFTPRYAAAPAMLLISAAAAVLGRPSSGRQRALAVIATCLLAVVVAANLRVPNERAEGPRWSAEIERAESRCSADSGRVVVPVTPEGWTAVAPCRVLDR